MESTPVEHRHDAPGSRAGLAMDIRALLEKIGTSAADDGYTVAEIAAAMNWTVNRTRAEVKRLQSLGQCRPTKKMQPAMDGRTFPVAAYIFEEART
ncbi:hypothetical protein [Nitratidesulfovibrio sp. 1201_IL3209]|uniref:hypothetical protein n=1 Tax=Nitratidesulfovibrio sp. 1201_IL3209 TaxID=3084053 RepID=UPI002FDA9F55